MPQMGNEWSNKKGKKNRSVKVHGGEVKQSPFQRQTKECVGGGEVAWEVGIWRHSGCEKESEREGKR